MNCLTRVAHLASLVLLAPTSFACTQPPAIAPGVRFAIRAEDRLLAPTNEEIALAPRATAIIDVFEPRELRGGGELLRIDEVDFVTLGQVTSGNDEIVQVTRSAGSRIEVRTGRPGTATIRIVTAAWTHELPFIVAEPSRVEMAYATPDVPRGRPPILLLANGTARFRMRRLDAMGRLLGGTTDTLPVFVEPPSAGAVAIRPGDRDIVDVRFTQAGRGVLRSPGGAALDVEVVTPDAISALDVAGVDATQQVTPLGTVRVGARQLAVLRVRRGDDARVFGLIGLATLTSRTPAQCDVEDVSRWYADGVYLVVGNTAGTCTLTASLGERSVDVGVTIE